jgi:hypothetical protein
MQRIILAIIALLLLTPAANAAEVLPEKTVQWRIAFAIGKITNPDGKYSGKVGFAKVFGTEEEARKAALDDCYRDARSGMVCKVSIELGNGCQYMVIGTRSRDGSRRIAYDPSSERTLKLCRTDGYLCTEVKGGCVP